MAKVKPKKQKKQKLMCNPAVCDNCQYICEGDFLCDKYEELVVSDWQPNRALSEEQDNPRPGIRAGRWLDAVSGVSGLIARAGRTDSSASLGMTGRGRRRADSPRYRSAG